MMWMIFARAPRPDARVWPGRRLLAIVDAVAWPTVLAGGLIGVALPLGVVGQCALACCGVAAVRRAIRAVAANHRYHFTTWLWGRWLGLGLLFGGALKAVAVLSG